MINAAASDYVAQSLTKKSVLPSSLDDQSAVETLNIDDILRLLPHTSEAVACLCAEKLIRASLMNQRLADILLRRRDRASLIVLSEGVAVSPHLLAHLAKAGSLQEARAIAACPSLTDDMLQALVARNDQMIDRIIAECSGEPLPDRIVQTLTNRAFLDARLARILFSRNDLSSSLRASLFAHASPRERMTILTLANASASTRPHSVNQERLTALSAAIVAGDASALTALLGGYLNVSFSLLYTILSEASGATLALALKGMDVPAPLVRRACRWAKATHAGMPGGIEDVLETVSPSAALWIMSSILTIAKAEEPKEPVAVKQNERLIA